MLLSPLEYRERAYAKVNLMLRVVGRRPEDGYHLLEMINVEISLADEVVIRPLHATDPMTIEVVGEVPANTPVDSIQNPATSSLGRAFFGFCEAFGVDASISVILKKRIPVGAGLGGGTSDAAALLRWCWKHLLPESERTTQRSAERLAAVALSVGADVPYSLRGGCALVSGIGETITPLSWELSGVPLMLVIPPVSVPTPAVFEGFRKKNLPFSHSSIELFSADSPPRPNPCKVVANDLEQIVSSEWPVVGEFLSRLRDLGRGLVVGMSGSGSAIFCLSSSWNTDEEVAAELEQEVRRSAPAGAKIIACRIL